MLLHNQSKFPCSHISTWATASPPQGLVRYCMSLPVGTSSCHQEQVSSLSVFLSPNPSSAPKEIKVKSAPNHAPCSLRNLSGRGASQTGPGRCTAQSGAGFCSRESGKCCGLSGSFWRLTIFVGTLRAAMSRTHSTHQTNSNYECLEQNYVLNSLGQTSLPCNTLRYPGKSQAVVFHLPPTSNTQAFTTSVFLPVVRLGTSWVLSE